MASVDYYADATLSVAERHTTKRNVVVSKGNLDLFRTVGAEQLALAGHVDASFKFIDQVVGTINGQPAIEV